MKLRIFGVCLAAVALLIVPARAQEDPVPMTRVLLPVVVQVPVPGAFGSLWVHEAAIHNGSSEAVLIGGMYTGCQFVPCPWPQLAPGATIYPRLLGSITVPALLVDVEREHADAVTIELRIRDLSRQQESLGTEVPTIREEDAFAGPLQIVDVRRGGPFRGMLRIFEFDPWRSARVLVRFFGLNNDQWDPLTTVPDIAITERVVELPRQTAVHGSYPLYAQIPLDSIPELETFERIRIEIEPLKEGMRFWAMVSITNNVTQQVTLVTPK